MFGANEDGRVGVLHETIVALASRSFDVDLRPFERAPFGDVCEQLVPIATELLDAVIETAQSIVASVAPAQTGQDDDLDLFGEAAPAPPDALPNTAGDLAFLGCLELRQCKERLERAKRSEKVAAVLIECDTGLRRARKVLRALDQALARATFEAPRIAVQSELETSLAVRRAYAKFATRLLGSGDPTPTTLHAHLRRAGTSIAMLIGWDVYPAFRVRDRLGLRELQGRLLAWLREGGADADGGMHLWQDLVSFVRLLGEVNRRQELVEHDRLLLTLLVEHLRTGDTPDTTLASFAERLRGLDQELDQLFEGRDPERLRAAVQALSDRYRQAVAS